MGFCMSAALIAALAVASAPERPDARRLIEQVIASQEAKQQLQRQYAYRETTTTEFLRKDGSVRKAKSEAFQVTPSQDMKLFFGLFGKVSKGSEAIVEQLQAEDGLWLLENITTSLDARFYFFKKYRRRITYSYSDYQKYTVETDEGDFRKEPSSTSP